MKEEYKDEECKKLMVLDFEINTVNAMDSLNERTYLNDEVINFMLNIFEKIYLTDKLT